MPKNVRTQENRDKIIAVSYFFNKQLTPTKVKDLVYLYFGGDNGKIDGVVYNQIKEGISFKYGQKSKIPRNNSIEFIFKQLKSQKVIIPSKCGIQKLEYVEGLFRRDNLLSYLCYYENKKVFPSNLYEIKTKWLYQDPFNYKILNSNQENFIINVILYYMNKPKKIICINEKYYYEDFYYNKFSLYNLIKSALIQEMIIYNTGYAIFGNKYDLVREDRNKLITEFGSFNDVMVEHFMGVHNIDKLFKKLGLKELEKSINPLFFVDLVSRKTYLSLQELLDLLVPFLEDYDFSKDALNNFDFIAQCYYRLKELTKNKRCKNERKKTKN